MDENTIKEDFLRWTKFCVGCGSEKPQGIVMCEYCMHGSINAYEKWEGKIEMWLAKMYGQDVTI